MGKKKSPAVQSHSIIFDSLMLSGTGRHFFFHHMPLLVRLSSVGLLSGILGTLILCSLASSHPLSLQLFFGMACLMVMSAVIIWWTRRLERQLLGLSEALELLGQGKQVQVAVDGNGRISHLQRSFNLSAQSLSRHHEVLQAQIEQAACQLRQQNAQLEAIQHGKTRLLAAASHDLRQPLHALTLFADALQAEETDTVRREHVCRIQECAAALDRHFSEMLDLSRLDSGVVQPQWTDLPLDEVFDEVSRNFRSVAEQQGLRLVVRKTDWKVRSDHVMLARILNNLVSNALRNTCSGGVLLGARRSNQQVRVDIWDTGRGIEEQHLERVFDEFYQIPLQPQTGSLSRSGRGLGLGLATVRRLCELMDVDIRLSSRPGRGTLVSLWLRALQVPLLQVAAGSEPPLEVAGLRVLVVDDEPDVVEAMVLTLDNWGMQVESALGIQAALLYAQRWREPPDIVITDLLLHDGDGLALLRQLADLPHLCDQPRPAGLIITGETQPNSLRTITQAGVPMLLKPVAPKVLRESIIATMLTTALPTKLAQASGFLLEAS
ncbi:ATP-binding response regulator [Azotobacter chroococcum]|uniref:ATP-binding response regulator n=1 Tax=Azotobacter chroococcum TaxID=353 RepID=UPI00146B3B8E|nr:hybrid sensor histidine kinase/response regulator [Azotobacter chroococcum]